MQHNQDPGHLPDYPVLVICTAFTPLLPSSALKRKRFFVVWRLSYPCSLCLLQYTHTHTHTHILAQVPERAHSAHRTPPGTGSIRIQLSSFDCGYRISDASVGPVRGYCCVSTHPVAEQVSSRTNTTDIYKVCLF